MTKGWKIFIIIAVIVIALVGWVVGYYNSFISLSESVDGQWAQVENQYQRRFDLIPNLVASVQGIFNQERAVFDKLAEARTRYAGAVTINDKAAAATQVESALGRLLVIVENYPELRSTETVTQLMVQLEGTENRVSVERLRFNELVRNYNIRIKRFPGNVFAGIFGFSERVFFEAVEGAEVAPTVEFNQ